MSMKIAVIGASGNVGRRVVDEIRRRGHDAQCIIRHGASGRSDETGRCADIFDVGELSHAIRGCDALVSAYRAPDEALNLLADLATTIVAAAREAQVRRVITIGGAGSLEAEPGVKLSSTSGFPEHLKAKAVAHDEAIAVLLAAPDLEWTCFVPAAQIAPGQRTGRYRGAVGSLVRDNEGRSAISYEDFAHALVTELEEARHVREIYSVATQ